MKRRILDLYNNELGFFYLFRAAKKNKHYTFSYNNQCYIVSVVQDIIDN